MSESNGQAAAQETAPSASTAAPETASTEANTSTTEQGAPEGEQSPKDPNKALLRRIAQEADRRRAAEKERDELRAKAGVAAPAASDIDRLVDERIAAREQQKIAKAVYDEGKQNFADYDASVQNVSAVLGDKANSKDFLDVVFALPNAAAVIHKLGNDLETADEIANLPPAKMALKLAQISGSLQAPSQQKPDAAAGGKNPPPPLKPLGSSNSGTFQKDPNKMSISELDAFMKQKRKEKYGG